jgi:hypothetical protein
MSDDECIHGMNPSWCANCAERHRVASPPMGKPSGDRNRSKQDLVNDLCDILGVARHHSGPGSTLPPRIVRAAATRAKVRHGTMPKVGSAIAAKAGLLWGPECASPAGTTGGNPTVTRLGLAVMIKALGVLALPPVPAATDEP